jgi:predicted DNA-binding transcriptional regulator AlpA
LFTLKYLSKQAIMRSGGMKRVIEMQNTLNEREAGKYLGVSAAVLRLWRADGKGPRHFKAGEKLVRYRRVDLDSWIEARLSEPSVTR